MSVLAKRRLIGGLLFSRPYLMNLISREKISSKLEAQRNHISIMIFNHYPAYSNCLIAYGPRDDSYSHVMCD